MGMFDTAYFDVVCANCDSLVSGELVSRADADTALVSHETANPGHTCVIIPIPELYALRDHYRVIQAPA